LSINVLSKFVVPPHILVGAFLLEGLKEF